MGVSSVGVGAAVVTDGVVDVGAAAAGSTVNVTGGYDRTTWPWRQVTVTEWAPAGAPAGMTNPPDHAPFGLGASVMSMPRLGATTWTDEGSGPFFRHEPPLIVTLVPAGADAGVIATSVISALAGATHAAT